MVGLVGGLVVPTPTYAKEASPPPHTVPAAEAPEGHDGFETSDGEPAATVPARAAKSGTDAERKGASGKDGRPAHPAATVPETGGAQPAGAAAEVRPEEHPADTAPVGSPGAETRQEPVPARQATTSSAGRSSLEEPRASVAVENPLPASPAGAVEAPPVQPAAPAAPPAPPARRPASAAPRRPAPRLRARHVHTAPVAPAAVAGGTYTVQPGDSLWAITARLLVDRSSTAAVARAWPALYAANRDRIGPDPGLIHPGTVLSLPDGL